MELYPRKTASLTDVVARREVDILSHRCLKTRKDSVSIGLTCSGFYFYEHFNIQCAYAVAFYVQNRKMCLSKNIIYTNILLFLCPAWDRFSSGNVLYVIT